MPGKAKAKPKPKAKGTSGGSKPRETESASRLIDQRIGDLGGWRGERDVGRRLDALIVRTVPGVHEAVKWSSPFYGIEGQGWFLSIHAFTHYDIREDDELDEAQMAAWVKQAAALPGWVR